MTVLCSSEPCHPNFMLLIVVRLSTHDLCDGGIIDVVLTVLLLLVYHLY